MSIHRTIDSCHVPTSRQFGRNHTFCDRLATSKGVRAVRLCILVLALIMTAVPPAQASPLSEETDANTFLPFLPCQCQSVTGRVYSQTGFGMQTYGDTRRTSPYFLDLQESGARWARVQLSWKSAEREDVAVDEIKLGIYDKTLAAAVDGNIQIIATIVGLPDWAVIGYKKERVRPDHLDDFSDFVTALVERYDGDGIDDAPRGEVVKHWELLNEPDHVDRYGHYGDQYALLLAHAFRAAKAADPEAQIITGGVAYEWFDDVGGPFARDFLSDVLDAGGGAHMDGVAIHAYPSFGPVWTDTGPGIYEKVQFFRSMLTQYGLNKSIYITESGAKSGTADGATVTPEKQASYVVELLTQAAAADVRVVTWFMLFDPDPDHFPFQFGLVTRDIPNKRKLAFYTYQQTVWLMEDAIFERLLTEGETGAAKMLAYRFKKSDGTLLYSAWMNPIDTDQTASLSIAGQQARLYDIFARSRMVADGDDGVVDGAITVTVGRHPILVNIEK